MNINGISGNAASTQAQSAVVTPAVSGRSTTTADSPPETTQPKQDTVELTGTALAKSLKLSGQTAAQIALKMGLDVKTVDSYLNIKETTTQTNSTTQAQQVAQNTVAAPQAYGPAEEATESATQKAAETAQGKK